MDILIIKKSVYFLYIRLFYGDKHCPHPKKRMLQSALKLADQLVAANKPFLLDINGKNYCNGICAGLIQSSDV